ncbi:hypothetical protein ABWH74_001554 [Burkholderia vietnamiensis]|jgi:hypothetical protein|uniref:Uncharacterized protein n=1 Tax=Burkholderia vietnamiensis TaxID=60552 RepID=A0AAW7SZS1_BURVI|nr:hypothetical protein [Burkholderia vietnamiensis]MBR8009391.1 hypothetical protein [Burkholderia vietnamiensis]MBR8190421.1 hypothetical protein [Burkholderia vietnamiensis]MCA8270899.1 hypothetical protein [Burkholderia vietnamiensis]MCA8450293.1 hypothetical protein [Burkholderia vietnamiensis]MDN7412068.1 hypothetical protein [Burkholderia vietnamiensis]
MKCTLKAIVVAAALVTAASGAQAASYTVDVQFPDDANAKPVALELDDSGKPQTAKSPGGVFVAIYARHALAGKMLESSVNVIDKVGTAQASGTGITTEYFSLGQPRSILSPSGASVVLTLKQIHG